MLGNEEENTLAIFEAGISEPGEMEALEKIIRPTVGVLTNIGEAHSEGFMNNCHKFQEKMRLFEHCPLIIGREKDFDAFPEMYNVQAPGRSILTWGNSNKNTFVTRLVSKANSGFTTFTIGYKLTEHFFTIPFTDDASVENAIACCCICLLFIDASVIAERVKNLHAVDMRLQLVQGINNCSFINDSYSFDVTSFSIALDFFAATTAAQPQNRYYF